MRITKKHLFAVAVATLLFHTPQTSHQNILAMPPVDLQSVFKHQRELVGSKRSPSDIQTAAHADQLISQIVFEIVRESLPKKYKTQSETISKTIIEEANKYNMDPLFLVSVIKLESSFNPNAIGGVGEIGLMQIRPSTAKWLNDTYNVVKKVDLKDPLINIKLGAYFLNKLRSNFDNNSRYYISAYNMGASKVRSKVKKNVHPKVYVNHVMKHYVSYIDRLEQAAQISHKLMELESILESVEIKKEPTLAQN